MLFSNKTAVSLNFLFSLDLLFCVIFYLWLSDLKPVFKSM